VSRVVSGAHLCLLAALVTDQVHFKDEQPQVLLIESLRNNQYDSANAGRSQRALSISTQYLACGLTNRHIEIHGNLLEDSGVITTKVE